MGLYLVRDAFKSHWIEQNYGEKKTKHLYTCDAIYGTNPFFNCINDDTEEVDKDWKNFLKKLENAKSREDLEEFFDVDTYIRWQVARYLYGSWDHKTHEHNNIVYMYHDTTSEKDLWIPLLYDFDLNFGSRTFLNTTRTFEDEVVFSKNPLYELLNLNDQSEEVIRIMEEFMRLSFNPPLLIPRIDQLRGFLQPYVLEDRTRDENGLLPGRLERVFRHGEDLFDYESFLGNSEFTLVKSREYNPYSETSSGFDYGGIKQWVIERFKFACSYYPIDCSYADDFMASPYATNYVVDKLRYEVVKEGCKGKGYPCCILADTSVSTSDKDGQWGLEAGEWCLITDEFQYMSEACWSEPLGYPCCKNRKTKIKSTESNGREWGIEHGQWCGITSYQKCPNYSRDYSCCTKCKSADKEGLWGIEDGKWCSIPYSCQNSS